MLDLTSSQMRYLHTIYIECENNEYIRSVDIAKKMGVTKASVSRMVKLFVSLGYISAERYGKIKLMPKGESEGAIIDEKITRIYPFFADYLGLDKLEALDSTYSFICGFSDICIEKLLIKDWSMDSCVRIS